MVLTVLALFCFLLRVFPRLLLNKLLVSDTYFHLGTADDIRKNRYRVPVSLPYFVLPNKHHYPFLFHWLWAVLLPKKTWLFFERIAAPLFDTLVLIFIYLLASYADALMKLPGDFPDVPFLAAALYATAPALLRTGDGPRAYNMSPRIAAMLLYLVHLLTAWYFVESGNITALIITLLTGAMLYIFAIFSVQVLFLFMIPLGIFWSPVYPLLVLASFVISIPLSFGRSIGVFVATRKHSVYYARVQHKTLYPRYKTVIAYITEALRKVWGLVRHGQWRAFRDWYFQEPHYLHLLITVFPFMPLLLIYAFSSGGKMQGDTILGFFALVAATGLFFFLLTKHKPFLFLGSGERYLEYVLVPAFVLLAAIAAQEHWIRLAVYGWIVYGLLTYIYHVWNFIRSNKGADASQQELTELFKQFEKFPEGHIFPVNANHSKMVHFYAPERKILVYQTMRDLERLPEAEFKKIWGEGYNYPTADLNYIVNQYQVRYIIGSRKELAHYKDRIYQGAVPFDTLFTPVCETAGYVILERSAVKP